MDFNHVFIVKSGADVFRGFRNFQDAMTETWAHIEEEKELIEESGQGVCKIYPMERKELSRGGMCGFWVEQERGDGNGMKASYEIVEIYCQEM